jgi:hypothetical protein
MDHALRNALAVLVGQLLDQLVILQQQRAARAGGDAVLVVGTGAPAVVVRGGRAASSAMVTVLLGRAMPEHGCSEMRLIGKIENFSRCD